MDSYYVSFVDSKRAQLIQRVSLVMPLADELISRNLITPEAYSRIKSKSTSMDQMRELYTFLKGGSHIKSAFYHILKEQEPYLMDDLEREHIPDKGLTGTSCKTQESNSDTRDGEQKKTVFELKQRWHKISNRWHKLLADLLEDSDLQSIGNGKLFLCTKNVKYKIGDGCDGTTVYIGIKADGTEVAIKRMLKSHSDELYNEMSILRDRKLFSCNIVRYVDFVAEGEFNYLALQLCEYDLDGYMEYLRKKGEDERMEALKKVAKEVLLGLQVLHEANLLHRDIKPRNVLIDVDRNAQLADFGISRRLNSGESGKYTSRAGTAGWEAAEILADEKNEGMYRYKKSTDIQVLGMLVHYILSDGHHPFGTGRKLVENIMLGEDKIIVVDVEAKDLIEGMIRKNPPERLMIEEAVDHPYFWDDGRRDTFLRNVGDENAVQNFKEQDEKLRHAVAKYTTGRSFSGWKSKMPEDPRLRPVDRNLSDDLLGLLRYLRNTLVHKKVIFYEKNMFRDLFPDFFISALKLAKEMGWKT